MSYIGVNLGLGNVHEQLSDEELVGRELRRTA
jgi:hypothetical protein